MKRPAVFFDRDNTLIANDGYLGNPSGVVLIEGAADAVAAVRNLGYVTVVFSNQSGVARGMFSEEAVHAVNARMDEMLLDLRRGAVIDRHEFCPFHPDASVERYRTDSELRKPSPGMILQAEEKLGLDLTRSWVIGDAPRDIEAGHLAGCVTILLRNPAVSPSPAAGESPAVEPDFIVTSLREAAEVIAAHTPPPEPPAASSPEPPPEAATEEVLPQPGSASVPASLSPVEAGAAQADVPPATPPASSPESIPAGVSAAVPGIGNVRLEKLAEQILDEIRRNREQPHVDFSVSKLLAGIVQVMALATLMYAYLIRSYDAQVILEVGIFLQTFTIALLIMGKQGAGKS